MSRNTLNELGISLGEHLREQRKAARLSLRQLSELAGVSNPYLSQIERGLKRPSAEILQQLAKGLEVSAESLYVRAGILEEQHATTDPDSDVRNAITADAALTERQKAVLIDVYESFVAGVIPAAPAAPLVPTKAARARGGSANGAPRAADALRATPSTTNPI